MFSIYSESTCPILIVCIYLPPNISHNSLDLLCDLFEHTTTLPFQHKIIGGDFNLPQINWNDHPSDSRFSRLLSTLSTNNWFQCVNCPTRLNHTLDLLFTNGCYLSDCSALNSSFGSDHKLISVKLNLFKSPSYSPYLLSESSIINWIEFAAAIRKSDWNTFFLTDDVSTASSLFYCCFQHCIHVSSYLLHKRNRVSSPSDIPLHHAIRLDKLQANFLETNDFYFYFQYSQVLHEIVSSHTSHLIDIEKKAFLSNNKSQKLSKIWKFRTNYNNYVYELQNSQGQLIVDPNVTCEIFADFFSKSFTNNSGSTLNNNNLLPPTSINNLITVNFTLASVSSQIRKLKLSFHPGPDGISSAMIKLGGPDIPLLLMNLFNLSMIKSYFPDEWKISIVIPRFKKGPRTRVENYRPIHHTPIISRLMERIIKDKLFDHLTQNNLLYANQHGFLRFRSCNTCHLDFFNLLTNCFDSRKAIVVIYLDINKAFDKVPHDLLVEKIKSFGIGNPLLNWFAHYFPHRSFKVNINGHFSKPYPLTSGVVQGSVLGPLLFLLYINDMFPPQFSGKPFLFADDIKLVYTFNPPFNNECSDQIQSDLNLLDSWCNLWCMKFTTSKCNVLTHGCYIPPNCLSLHGSYIPFNSQVRDLGLSYSTLLNFSDHINSLVAKARYLSNLLFRKIHTRNARVLLFKTTVRPLLEYSSLIFSNLNKCDRLAIERVQRSFTKLLYGSSNSISYRDRCTSLHLDPLWLRRLKINLAFVFRLSHCSAYSTDTSLSFRPCSQYALRNTKCTFYIPFSRSTYRSKFFLIKYLVIWNSLPSNVRESSNLSIFKHNLCQFANVENLASMHNVTPDFAFEQGLLDI